MSSPICIPNPIVIIKWCARIFVYFAIERTPIPAILAHTNRTFECTIIRGIEYSKVILVITIHMDMIQSFIPYSTSISCYATHIIVLHLAIKICLGLFLANKRYAVTQMHFPGTLGIRQRSTIYPILRRQDNRLAGVFL